MTNLAKSYRTVELKGKQEPSARIVPACKYSDGEDAVKILQIGDLYADPWQENVLIDWMGRDEEDIWTSSTCGLAVPRQNGKTLITSGRMASGMVMNAEWVIYTAHLQKTATETFMELKAIFESPKLIKRVKEIKSAIGREQIFLKNGGRCIFVARTRNGGRGLHGDSLVFDEAQELTTEQQASFLPALAASSNPQTIYIGTPPDENCAGTVFRQIREKALNNESNSTAWSEFSVPEIGDLSDRQRWADTNPALGRRIRLSTIEAEYEQMAPDTFARERLGWWSPVAVETIDYALDKDAWENCKSFEMKPEGKTAYGVKFSPDGQEVCLCGAVVTKDGKARISLIDRKPMSHGTRWLAEWLNDRYNKASCVVIDGRNGVDLLIDRIADTWKAKGSIIKASVSDMLAAATVLSNDLNENNVTWYGKQDALDESATTSIKRPIGGGWGFGGDNSAPIEACALALWGARTSKRDPSKKMRIG